MDDFKSIIRSFGSAASLAREIGEEPVTVRQWGNRNSIPPVYWQRVVKAAQSRKIKGVSIAEMARISATRTNEAQQ